MWKLTPFVTSLKVGSSVHHLDLTICPLIIIEGTRNRNGWMGWGGKGRGEIGLANSTTGYFELPIYTM